MGPGAGVVVTSTQTTVTPYKEIVKQLTGWNEMINKGLNGYYRPRT